jgi:hypothetical protein
MKCQVLFKNSDDNYYWIYWEQFVKIVDKNDLACRNSKEIKPFYCSKWFHVVSGENKFIPPAIYIDNGVVKFINGRHRTLLLAKYLSVIPIAVSNISFSNLETLKTAIKSEIQSGEYIELPDLPVN